MLLVYWDRARILLANHRYLHGCNLKSRKLRWLARDSFRLAPLVVGGAYFENAG